MNLHSVNCNLRFSISPFFFGGITQSSRPDLGVKHVTCFSSDNPKLDASFLERSVRWPGPKELISLRLDREVLAFFRSQGKGYQTTINSLLRKYMEAQELQASSHRSEKRARKK